MQISIAGGLHRVVKRATERGCETIQIFSRNPRSWQVAKGFSPDELKELRHGLNLAEIEPLILHLPYLSNLASPEEGLYQRSIAALIEELSMAKILEAPYVVCHMGSHKGGGEDLGLQRLIQAINAALKCQDSVMILLENMSGEGSELGYDLEHLRVVIDGVKYHEQVGVCFDLCHAYQAGLDVATRNGLDKTLRIFDELLGLDRLRLVHASDSKTRFASHLDRHEHIGKGFIGQEGFRVIVNHPALMDKPFILETPITSPYDDQINLNTIRRLVNR